MKVIDKQKLIQSIILAAAQTLALNVVEPEDEVNFIQLIAEYNTYFTGLDINAIYRAASEIIPFDISAMAK